MRRGKVTCRADGAAPAGWCTSWSGKQGETQADAGSLTG